MSTWPCWMKGSRLLETVSLKVIPDSSTPSDLAMIFAILDVEAAEGAVRTAQAEPGLVVLDADGQLLVVLRLVHDRGVGAATATVVAATGGEGEGQGGDARGQGAQSHRLIPFEGAGVSV